MSDTRGLTELPVRKVSWRGRSGRIYALAPLSIREFVLRDDQLHMVSLGRQVLWAGSAREVIDDSVSRARLRAALGRGDRAFALGRTEDAMDRMALVWDLEGAELEAGAAAA